MPKKGSTGGGHPFGSGFPRLQRFCSTERPSSLPACWTSWKDAPVHVVERPQSAKPRSRPTVKGFRALSGVLDCFWAEARPLQRAINGYQPQL